MRGVHAVFIHADLPERRVDPLADLRARHAEVLRGEGNVVLHYVGDDLVVRVLEDHAHGAADGDQLLLVGRVHVLDPNLALRGDKDSVHVLGEGGFAGAVMPQHRHEAPLFDLEVNAPEGLFLLIGIGIVYVFKTDDRQFDTLRSVFISPSGSSRRRADRGRCR